MPDYQRQNNEDLFYLPLGDIEAILGDANNILVQASNEMIEKLLSISLEIDNIDSLKELLKKAKQIKSTLRNYRLKDGKPYKVGKEKIDNFYKGYESRIDSGVTRINEFLNELANNETDDNQTNDTEIDDTEVIINQNFELKWSVESFNKQILDYNVLKPFLSDYYVKLALSAHLKANGPNLIDGVEYKRKVQ